MDYETDSEQTKPDGINEPDQERCPDCGSTEAGDCFYCKMD